MPKLYMYFFFLSFNLLLSIQAPFYHNFLSPIYIFLLSFKKFLIKSCLRKKIPGSSSPRDIIIFAFQESLGTRLLLVKFYTCHVHSASPATAMFSSSNKDLSAW